MTPHLAIRASAGAGKTYQLTSRFVGLLGRGEQLDQLLASTFSRKAAGEIIMRVLARLAEGEDARAQRLLGDVVKKLHRLRIGTLDAFFMALVQSFGLELGFSPSWRILDEALDKALKTKAVHAALSGEGADASVLGPHVHALQRGESRRGVVGVVEEHAHALLQIWLDAPREAWDFVPESIVQPLRGLDDVLQSLAAVRLEKPALQTARDADVQKARSGELDELLRSGISAKVLAGESTFKRIELPPALVTQYHALHAILRYERGQELAAETRALHALLSAVAERYAAYKHALDGYGFDDISRILARKLGRAGALDAETLSDIYFRLDGRIHHLLLDEFQDTSLAQWQVLEPIAREIVSYGDGTRSFFCVGDVKQAIYGWRGGVSEIFDKVDSTLGGIETQPLDESRRSAPVIMAFVNTVFEDLTHNVALIEQQAAAEAWSLGFKQHATVHKEMPGHVRVTMAPRAKEKQSAFNLAYAADVIVQLSSEAKDASIGVLVRRNGAVRRIIWELSERGIIASEEGGNPLTDSTAVMLILSLLELCDHPGHSIARYHVATSPLGHALGYSHFESHADSLALAERVRRSLVEQGYGPTIRHYTTLLEPACDARNARRLAQLAELAERYDVQAKKDAVDLMRASTFVAFVRETKMEEPLPARVRVMTIHQAKGLEFDVAVVCDIDESLAPKATTLAVDRVDPMSPPRRLFRAPSKDEQRLFPELRAMCDVAAAQSVKEKLSNLYVALTRPKHALHVILNPDRENGKTVSKTVGNVVRGALRSDPGIPAGTVLYEAGDPAWAERVHFAAKAPVVQSARHAIRLRAPERFVARATPSSMEGGNTVDMTEHLRLERRPAMERGAWLHALLEQIAWLEDGIADDATLALALAQIPGLDVPAELLQFRRLLESDGMRRALSKERFAFDGANLRVYRELPFAVREDKLLITGSFDRVVVARGEHESRLTIIDWKTDRVSDEQELMRRVAYYKPQLEAYRRAAVTVFRVPIADVRCELVFLAQGGRTVEV